MEIRRGHRELLRRPGLGQQRRHRLRPERRSDLQHHPHLQLCGGLPELVHRPRPQGGGHRSGQDRVRLAHHVLRLHRRPRLAADRRRRPEGSGLRAAHQRRGPGLEHHPGHGHELPRPLMQQNTPYPAAKLSMAYFFILWPGPPARWRRSGLLRPQSWPGPVQRCGYRRRPSPAHRGSHAPAAGAHPPRWPRRPQSRWRS